MANKILVIGDVANVFASLRKFTKTEIHIINFPKSGPGNFTYSNDYELFENSKVLCQIKKINEIKNKFDFCITMGTGEILAYLCNLNFVPFYVGRDIDAPRFIKNSKEDWYDEPLHKLNFLERRFYKDTFDNAIEHIAYGWVFEHLKKFTDNGIKMDMEPVDPELFNDNTKPLDREKSKFTFFSPQRMGKPKGTDILWKALEFCKTDFDILQVEWFDESTKEELDIKKRLIREKPKNVKFIPKIKRNDMPRYYNFSDAVIGNLRIGFHELITCESVLCKKPIVQYANPKFKVLVDGKDVQIPFVPESKDPKEIAKTIDKIVESELFRKDLYEKQLQYIKKISDPVKVAKWWDEFLEGIIENHESIRKNSSKSSIKFRMFLFQIANRLYLKKIRKLFN